MAEVTSYDINKLEKKIDYLSQISQEVARTVGNVDASMNNLSNSMTQVSGTLKVLNENYERFRDESKKEAMLQKATSELIRVRQEIEQRFGRYSVVRETMLGVLKATDNALVKNATITNVSEELILATPDYWLSPCLVAVAAWIDNNRDLAERAIKVALERDEEKTALTMALICRRNNRIDTCYEWLSLYFEKLDARNFSENDYCLNTLLTLLPKELIIDYKSSKKDEFLTTLELIVILLLQEISIISFLCALFILFLFLNIFVIMKP